MDSINRRQVAGLLVFVAVVVVLANLAIGPPMHEIHSLGGAAVTPAVYQSRQGAVWWPGPPTQTLAEVKCIRPQAPQPPCTDADVANAFPALRQTDQTLYYVWAGCRAYAPTGFNLEYFASSRTLVIHCYRSAGWISPPDIAQGSRGLGFISSALLTIPTAGMGSGLIHIDEDDRIEHIIGDQSYEYGLTAISLR